MCNYRSRADREPKQRQNNQEKTELLWCTTSRRQHRLPTATRATLSVGSTTVAPVSSVRDLRIFVDSDLVMRTHVCRTVSRLEDGRRDEMADAAKLMQCCEAD